MSRYVDEMGGSKGERSGTMDQSVLIATTFDRLEELRAKWECIEWPRLDGELDYYTCVMRNRAEILKPYAVLVESHAEPAAAAAARIERISLPTRLGYKTIFNPKVRSLTVAIGGAAIPSGDPGHAKLVVEALLGALANHEADVVWFQSLPVDSAFAHAIAESVGPVRRQALVEQRWHHRLNLPGTYDEFLSSRSRRQRKNLKAARSKVEGTLGDALSIEVLRNADDLPKVLHTLETIAGKTYQRGLGVGFIESAETRAILDLATNRGWHSAWVLYNGADPIAFWTGWQYRRTLYISTTAFDPAFAELGVGTYLLAAMVRDFCADGSVEAVDFGPGDAAYKRHFGNESWLERDFFVFAPTLRGAFLNAARTSIGAVDVGVKRLLERTGSTERVKRIWRRRLAAHTND